MKKSERLRIIRKKLLLTQAEIASIVGISTTGYQNYETGNTDFSEKLIRFLLEKHVNVDWLLNGTGNMFTNEVSTVHTDNNKDYKECVESMQGKRLQEIRNALGYKNQKDFALKLKISSVVYNNYETGTHNIPDDIENMLYLWGINLNWLYAGEGTMFRKDSYEAGLDTRTEYSKINKKGEVIDIMPHDDAIVYIEMLPQRISAGIGQPNTQVEDMLKIPVVSRLLAPHPVDKVRGVEVIGDSMNELGIYSEDLILFVESDFVDNGIYVVRMMNDFFVKRIEVNPFEKRIKIMSANAAYSSIEISFEQEKNGNFEIMGRAIALLHRF